MDTRFARFVLNFPGRLPMPIGAYAGTGITGDMIWDVVSRPEIQTRTVLALHERFQTPVLFTAMDLSAEAEAYGCEIRMADREVPTVVGRRAASLADIAGLSDP
ncbi:MAG: hypothetical protein WBC70_14305, partial [Candidatus Aminicenantales bacterium]